MSASVGNDLLSRMDVSPVSARYWVVLLLIAAQLLAELFDFFIASFLVSALAPLWKLTFGQTSIMLLSAGVGAIAGAVLFGWLADRIGRKPTIILSCAMCFLAAGSISLIPDGQWLLFALVRFLVGVGYGGAGVSQFPLITEYTPTARRTVITGLVAIPAGLGFLAASLIAAQLLASFGWRGVAALGFVPLVLPAALLVAAPESARWLIAHGRTDQARAAARSMFRLSAEDAEAPIVAPPAPPKPNPAEVLAYPRQFWLVALVQLGLGTALTGVATWGPTILAQLFQLPPSKAAGRFAIVSIAGLAGRLAFALLPHAVGRRATGMLVCYAGAAALALAAIFHDSFWAGAPLFFVFLLIGHFFYDGAYSNLNTYAAELYPVRLASLGMSVSASAGGLGKILGPLALGLIAGTSNLITPKATEAAVVPGFLFMSAACLVAALAYTLLGVETHRKALALA